MEHDGKKAFWRFQIKHNFTVVLEPKATIDSVRYKLRY